VAIWNTDTTGAAGEAILTLASGDVANFMPSGTSGVRFDCENYGGVPLGALQPELKVARRSSSPCKIKVAAAWPSPSREVKSSTPAVLKTVSGGTSIPLATILGSAQIC